MYGIHVLFTMKKTITTTMEADLYDFLLREAKQKKTSRKAVIEAAIKLYKKVQLEERVKEGLQEREKEHQKEADAFREAQILSLDS